MEDFLRIVFRAAGCNLLGAIFYADRGESGASRPARSGVFT
jgi:hypothetical protein